MVFIFIIIISFNLLNCFNLVRNIEYIYSIHQDKLNSLKFDDLSLKDFLDYRKEFTKESLQDESLNDFKIKINKTDYEFFEKKTFNSNYLNLIFLHS
jgi:hypothetical protein